jgi:hypothetical protein
MLATYAPNNAAKHAFTALPRGKSFLFQSGCIMLNLRRLRVHRESFPGQQ